MIEILYIFFHATLIDCSNCISLRLTRKVVRSVVRKGIPKGVTSFEANSHKIVKFSYPHVSRSHSKLVILIGGLAESEDVSGLPCDLDKKGMGLERTFTCHMTTP